MTDREKINILLVDDQPAKLLTYEAILRDLGENLIRATSGRDALEQLLKKEVAVLLVDVNMPDLDGFELAQIVRQHPRFQRTAIIFISAVHLTDPDRVKGYQLGAVDYVPVPIVPEILRAKVSVFVELYRKTRQLEQTNAGLETRVEERTAALTASEERFRLATEAMRGGLYDWNLQDDSVWRSSGACALVGYSSDEPEPTIVWWQERIHADDLESGWREIQTNLAGDARAFDVQYRVRHRDGHWIWIWDRGRIVRDQKGLPARIVGHCTDISAQKTAEDALKETNLRKDAFLATLSHELRNPLAPIRNALTVLRMRDASDEELGRSREIIDRQVTHLSRLVDDLLDVNRISHNRLQLRKSAMDLAEAVNAAVEASAPLFGQYGVELTVSSPPQALQLHGDVIRLTQVFTNLLSNSAKYTPKGGHVWLTVEPEGEAVIVRVRDTGVGIRADKLQRVFEMFYQANDADEADGFRYSEQGFGIGLTLAAHIVELHHGRIEAHSGGVNAGSEFVVRLPMVAEPVDAGELPELPYPGNKEAIAVRKVLVADDSADSAETLAMLLRLKGYEVRMAHDGREAVETAAEFVPDAVLLDIGMPTLDGYEAARKIRGEPWGKNVLLIAQTGWGQDRDQKRAHQAGFDAHLTKPLDYDLLMELLANWAPKEDALKGAR